MLFSGLFDLPWWGLIMVTLVLTHISIAAVTIYLHRHQAHRALDLHPAASHFFRLWLCMTTGMVTKEWVAVHRKHHAKCETPDDPHSPQVYGIRRVLWGGVFLYVREACNRQTLERYGHGTPDDWMERNVYSNRAKIGLMAMALIDIGLFGIVPGLAILAVQIAWIPFWAAGVINGIGHYWGYRNWSTADASTNILPLGILIGGEELHNNHHAFGVSAKLSNRWYEFDIGWMYIRMLSMLGMAKVKKLAPRPRFTQAKPVADFDTLQAVIACRYDVLAKYAKSLKNAYAEELRAVRSFAPQDAQTLKGLKRWLNRDEKQMRDEERVRLAEALAKSKKLSTVYAMRRELAVLWERSNASSDQLLKQLQDWCRRAEASGIRQLEEFSLRLRCYA